MRSHIGQDLQFITKVDLYSRFRVVEHACSSSLPGIGSFRLPTYTYSQRRNADIQAKAQL